MDDTCAVCAEALEWVAYGPCGHREVCSTCIIRLRFVCNDHRCCICKSDSSIIFVTKAFGDYTKVITDFSVLPAVPIEGQVGQYWYHEVTQAFFDDLDHYNMTKTMCRLSCVCCEKVGEQGIESPKRRGKFRNIEQLKSHLSRRHNLFMCSLCLEGRKIFLCEQKLYTKAQLKRHIATGDSEIDGSESERGGFIGHPACEFCRNPFYGDNELYSHMSTEHYTCHICQRRNPGQYVYHKNYDDLEMHFRQDHFLCEDACCLEKKFVVFATQSEMKKHNTMEHGRQCSSLSKRNSSIQILTGSHYQHGSERDLYQRGQGFYPNYSERLRHVVNQASLEAANTGTPSATSSGNQVISNCWETVEIDSVVQRNSRNGLLQESSFPPLPMSTRGGQQKFGFDSGRERGNTMATQLCCQSSFSVIHSLQACPAAAREQTSSISSSQLRPSSYSRLLSPSAPANSSISNPVVTIECGSSNHERSTHNRNAASNMTGSTNSGSSVNGNATRMASHSVRSLMDGDSPWSNDPTKKFTQCVSSPMVGGSFNLSISDFPAVSSNGICQDISMSNFPLLSAKKNSKAIATRDYPQSAKGSNDGGATSNSLTLSAKKTSKDNVASDFSPLFGKGSGKGNATSDLPPVSPKGTSKNKESSQSLLNLEDMRAANKSLVEKIRSSLEFDEEKYHAFKEISSEYRQDLISTGQFLACVSQFGLSHLVFEIARLCPDAQKQKELLEACHWNLGISGSHRSSSEKKKQSKNLKVSNKGKEKCEDNRTLGSGSVLANSIMSSVSNFQSAFWAVEEEVEEVCPAKGKSKALVVDDNDGSGSVDQVAIEPRNKDSQLAIGGLKKNVGGKKQKKKTSKFLRSRLGDSLPATFLDLTNSDSGSEWTEKKSSIKDDPPEGLPVRGVWQNGGGRKLVANW